MSGCKAYIYSQEMSNCIWAGKEKKTSLPLPPALVFLPSFLFPAVRVGQIARRIQTQEFPDERRDLPLPYCHAQRVSRDLLQMWFRGV